jgi:hypothetical protein
MISPSMRTQLFPMIASLGTVVISSATSVVIAKHLISHPQHDLFSKEVPFTYYLKDLFPEELPLIIKNKIYLIKMSA